jgi:hypothetical protein
MGFNKRFINRDSITSKNNIKDILNLLKADAVICDNWSSNFFKNISEKWKDYQSIRESLIRDNIFSSAIPDVSEIKDMPLSVTYFNLINNPNWIDIELCLSNFRPIDIPNSIQGRFDELCKFCISLIENKYNNESN